MIYFSMFCLQNWLQFNTHTHTHTHTHTQMTYAASRAFVVDTRCFANVKNQYALAQKCKRKKTW